MTLVSKNMKVKISPENRESRIVYNFRILANKRETLIKRYQLVTFLLLFFLMHGCASFEVPIERRVEGNTFYSEKYPKVKIKVSDDLQFVAHERERKKPESDTGVIGSRKMKIDHYLFANKKEGRFLKVKVHFILEDRWSLLSPDYSKQDGVMQSGEEYLFGTRYSTGIFLHRTGKGWVTLNKSWGRLAGDAIALEILYMELMSRLVWDDVTTLNEKQQKELQEFIERSNNSFEIIP